ncbi:integrase core domain-containing protein [Muricauda oceani]|uniref:Transposase n=2 Tax=Flagellimonas TaxID=444459 RepID=A0A6G7IYC8_9FLAO|nr:MULTISPECIES: integrase core domain-containing protein [Allomuricauda]MBW8244673.1 integrase core domain-containing protein [Allomuricauda oceani]MDF0708781.1 integrase core domain-containing protein [[Muricauda] okinawensis]QII43613.1 transposase [Allomuricauda oceani]
MIAAWKMAVGNRPPSERSVFHSDRGIQYACQEFVDLLESYRCVERSMSCKGNCWDNAVAKSFFKSIKVELIHRKRHAGKKEAALSVFEWIETWYNKSRTHSALGNMTIDEFENLSKIKNAA